MKSEAALNSSLAKAAKRAARGPAPLLAPLMEEWRRVFDNDLAAALGVTDRAVVELALCRRPRPDRWEDDASEIASEFGIDIGRFVPFLRAAEALELLGSAHREDGDREDRLLAARDREEHE